MQHRRPNQEVPAIVARFLHLFQGSTPTHQLHAGAKAVMQAMYHRPCQNSICSPTQPPPALLNLLFSLLSSGLPRVRNATGLLSSGYHGDDYENHSLRESSRSADHQYHRALSSHGQRADTDLMWALRLPRLVSRLFRQCLRTMR